MSEVASPIAVACLRWFETHARDLAWRGEGVSAWAILVSEVMLQQTPVPRVTPLWQEWLQRWPTPADLAAAPVGEAIRAWGRLGYPRRAMRLHACAVAIVQRHDGQVPTTLEEMLALPGVGDYTARAVLAFAYGQRHAVVDTNVRRLLARALHGVEDGAVSLAAVEELLPDEPAVAARASAAMMEVGALICTARTPACRDCPLATDCRWRSLGSPAPDKPYRRPQSYAGTDRQVRGLLLAAVREAAEPVDKARLDLVWSDGVQRERALRSLLQDGLIIHRPSGVFALPDNR